jgi:uncharacterized protein (TIGR02284 family)
MQQLQTTKTDINLTSSAADALIIAHRRTVDALAGYDTMIEKAKPEIRPIVEQFRTLHASHADTLGRYIADLGLTPDQDGSIMGSVNKAVVSLRAMFDDIDADVMESIRNGEEHVRKAFDDAVANAGSSTVQMQLQQMRDELVALIDRTRQSG